MRVHGLECARDLLGRPIPNQHLRYQMPKDAIGMQLRPRLGCASALLIAALRIFRAVARSRTVACQFSADGAGRAFHQRTHGSYAVTLRF